MSVRAADLFTWIATVILGALSGLSLWLVLIGAGLPAYIVLFCFVSATLLLLPSIWKDNKRRLVRVGAAVILVMAGLMMPVRTRAVKLDMPAPQSSPDRAK